jgi:hypothetical protein
MSPAGTRRGRRNLRSTPHNGSDGEEFSPQITRMNTDRNPVGLASATQIAINSHM